MLLRTLTAVALILAASAAAQAPPVFEVASSKPNASGDNRVMIRMAPGGRFMATGVTLRALMGQAYNVRDSRSRAKAAPNAR